MGLYVNTNTASLNAQRNLNKATRSLDTSFQRLSSGQRINSAKDDAAGLAIAERFTTQVRGLNQAVRNTGDGVSLAQTAEGGLQETNNILQRMRELSVQSANDTNTTQDRDSIQDEMDQLINEIDRIATKTTFNGKKVLDGSFAGAKFHIGANAGESLQVNIGDGRSQTLGRQARVGAEDFGNFNIAQGDAEALADGDLTINDVDVRASVEADDLVSTTGASSSAIAKAAAINDSTEFTGVRAIANATVAAAANGIQTTTLDSSNNLVINNEVITGFVVEDNDANHNLVNAINSVADRTGVVATLDEDHKLNLTAEDGRNIDVFVNGDATKLGLIANPGTGQTFGGTVTLQSSEQMNVKSGTNSLSKIGLGGNDHIFGANSDFAVDTIDVTTREGANLAIDTLDVAISQVSDIRSGLGAVQNRLGSTVRNLETSVENLSASRSRIMDTDFSKETAEFTKNQILQQAGLSILAQSNQKPNVALSLLG
jgi:flagellin